MASSGSIRKILFHALSFLPQSLLDKAEGYIAQLQGKGWGDSTLQYELDSCLSLFKEPPCSLVDIGARYGDYTANFISSPILPKSAYLFEPSRTCTDFLTRRFSDYPDVYIIKCALSDENTVSTLYYPYSGSGFSSLNKRVMLHHDLEFSQSEVVHCVPFHEFFNESDLDLPIDFVKIDVEGYELKVLKGFGEILKDVKLIQFEFGSAHIDSRVYFQDFWYFFQSNNFILFRITPSGPHRLKRYKERYENFSTTNYIALNMRYSSDFNLGQFVYATE